MVDEVSRKCPLVEDCGSRSIKDRDGENVAASHHASCPPACLCPPVSLI